MERLAFLEALVTDGPDALGILGAVISIYCYARAQWQREYVKRMEYSLGNLIGTILILISLAYHWNVASFISNIAWGIVSLYGVYRCAKYMVLEKRAPRG